jgi:hypothetical protein
MYGMPRPRKRTRRAKKRTESRLTPKQRHERALELIRPAPEDRAVCETWIDVMVHKSQGLAEQISKNKPARKRDRDQAIKKLCAVELAARNSPGIIDEWLVERIKWECEFLKQNADKAQRAAVRPGGRRRDPVKREDTLSAWALLRGFGSKPPALREGGIWHQLSATIHGYPTVDLFSFDYLRLVSGQIRKAAAARKEPPLPDPEYEAHIRELLNKRQEREQRLFLYELLDQRAYETYAFPKSLKWNGPGWSGPGWSSGFLDFRR